MSREIVIIGAGIIGVCCARWLQRDGHRVHLIDPQPPGEGCSYGNAGIFATESIHPLATPDTLRALPGMLLNRDAGVVLRWPHLPRMLPWLVRFLANARPRRVEAITRVLAELCGAAEAAYRPLIEGRPAGELVRRTGWATVFETERAFDTGRRALDDARRHGVSAHVLDGNALRDSVPELAPHVAGGIHHPHISMCADPGGFVARLADDVVAEGGRIERARLRNLEKAGERIRVHTDDGAMMADHVVIAAGIDSGAIAAALGDRFPLETERGYHAMIADAGIAPVMPVISGEYLFVTTPMAAGLRLAGTTELAGLWRPPDPGRVETILRHGRRLFPALRAEWYDDWMGFRSTLPDSLPVIGRSPRDARISYAFGHQHLGLTLGGLTGRLIADQLAGRTPVVDPAPVSPARFSRIASRL